MLISGLVMLKTHHRANRRLPHGCVQSAHQLHSRPFLGLKGVPVLVQGNGGVCVSQQLGESHRVHPLLQSPCCKGMAQRMKVGAGDAGTGYAPLEQVLVGRFISALENYLPKSSEFGVLTKK